MRGMLAFNLGTLRHRLIDSVAKPWAMRA